MQNTRKAHLAAMPQAEREEFLDRQMIPERTPAQRAAIALGRPSSGGRVASTMSLLAMSLPLAAGMPPGVAPQEEATAAAAPVVVQQSPLCPDVRTKIKPRPPPRRPTRHIHRVTALPLSHLSSP